MMDDKRFFLIILLNLSIHILTECLALQIPKTLFLGAYEIKMSDLPNLEPLKSYMSLR